MQFIKKEFSATIEIKKSKFITHICPYEDFKTTMAELRQKHPKARHFVYAYRYLNEYDQIVENCSDDGEPKGTSGRPALNVLAGSGIINGSVIIIRYFGGIKLGTGGLVKAYSDAVNLVLSTSELIPYVKLAKKILKVSYNQLSQIEYMISKFEINIVKKDFDELVVLSLEASNEEFDKLSNELFRDCVLVNEI